MYSPKIDEKLIPELYKLKQKTKLPMTTLVNQAIAQYLKEEEKKGGEHALVLDRN